MVALYWIVKVYKWWLVAWVIMTWIPGLAGSMLHNLIGIPVVPVIAPFNFLSIGPIGFGPIVPLLILNWAEDWLGKQSGIEVSEDQAEVQEAEIIEVTGQQKPADSAGSNVGL